MVAIDTKSFKSGNSVAVRFPRGTGLQADLDLTITREGDEYRIKLSETLMKNGNACCDWLKDCVRSVR